MKNEKGECEMYAYATKPRVPFITRNELKRTQPTSENRKLAEFLDSHNFSFSVDQTGKKIVSSCSKK